MPIYLHRKALAPFAAGGRLPGEVDPESPTAQPPGVFIGTTLPPSPTLVGIEDSVRHRDVYILGAKQTGKSTVLLNMLVQDINAGKGIAIIDPHGDLAKDLLPRIPKKRAEDVIYFDSKLTPIPICILDTRDPEEAETIASELSVTFKSISEGSWGPQMDTLFKYAIHALIHIPNSSFLDLLPFISSPGYRNPRLHHLKNDRTMHIHNYWKYRFKQEKKTDWEPVARRLSDFDLNPTLRHIFECRDPSKGLDILKIMDSGKILIVNLVTATSIQRYYIGSVLVSKILQASFRRHKISKSERRPFFLYVDEFQQFKTNAFHTILTETGKFKLHLVIANQLLGDLEADMRRAISGNVGSFVFRRLSSEEARFFADKLKPYEPEQAVALRAKTEAIYYSCVSNRALLINTFPPPSIPAKTYEDEILRRSRQLAAPAPRRDEREVESEEEPAGRPDVSDNPPKEENP